MRSAILLAIILVSSGVVETRGEQPTQVTANQLLRTPQQFNDKKLFVTGYFVYDAIKGGSLFADYWAAEHKGASISVNQSVFVNPGTPTNPPPPIPGVSDACELKNCYVKLIGTFCCQGPACELNHIVFFRKTKRSPKTECRPCGMYQCK